MRTLEPRSPRFSSRPSPARRRFLLAAGLTFGLALVVCSWLAPAAASEPVVEFRVIVNPSNPTHSASAAFLADAFLKKTTRWDSGETIRPLDQRPDSTVRRAFSRDVLKRAVTAVRSYWQQRIFSGRDVPPPELDSDDSVVAYVAHNPGAVGYVSGGAKLGNTRELALQ